MTASMPLLVSAGEASGDRIAALALRALGKRVNPFGMGGDGCRQAGADLIVHLSEVAVMGWLPVVRRVHTLMHAQHRLQEQALLRGAPVALLVGFTSFNQRLGRRLRERGIRVLWCVAPQAWAWRPSRLSTLRASVDRLAVILPFEEALWRERGYSVSYVGHPAVEATRWRTDEGGPKRLVVLTGSRDQEVRATAGPMLQAARDWCDGHASWQAETVVAGSLSRRCGQWLQGIADRWAIPHVQADPVWGAAQRLHHYRLALCASGTASLEAALAGVPPVVGYRCDPVTAWLARRLVRTAHMALPNILLGRRTFPELLQHELTPPRIVAALQAVEANWIEHHDACARVRGQLETDDARSFGEKVAALVE